jgi:hypothetical protein
MSEGFFNIKWIVHFPQNVAMLLDTSLQNPIPDTLLHFYLVHLSKANNFVNIYDFFC